MDRLLDGGLSTGCFTHVYGEAASGKTTIALQFLSSACRLGIRSIYINTESASPIERFEQVTGKPFQELEKHITLLIPSSFEEQGHIIDDLQLYTHEDTRLILVDTLTRLYRARFEDKKTTYAAHRELNRQSGFLKGLAKHQDTAVLVLNQVRGSMNSTDSFEPVAKNILDYWSDCTLELRMGRAKSQRIIARKGLDGGLEKAVLYLVDSGFSISTPHRKE